MQLGGVVLLMAHSLFASMQNAQIVTKKCYCIALIRSHKFNYIFAMYA